jgi:alkyl hydroperoxide reductase subunit AhpC
MLVRRKAPAFTAPALFPDGSIKPLSLADYKGKYVCLFYYPLDFTFVCPTEIIDFSERARDFSNANCALIGASCDSAFSHHAWTQLSRKQGGLGAMQIPLLADVSKKIAHNYGFLVENEADADDGVPMRGTVIIDKEGTVRHISINDAPVGRSVDEVLRLVKAFQHVDLHGEVCPSGWTPGKKSMKADRTGSLEYFKTVKDA